MHVSRDFQLRQPLPSDQIANIIMRSLTILTYDVRAVKGKKPEARYTGLAIRPEEVEGITSGQGETVYIASERPLPDGGVEIQIFISNVPDGYSNSVSFDRRCSRSKLIKHHS